MIAPPLRVTRSAAMARPRPAPPSLVDLWNGSKYPLALIGRKSGAGVADLDQRQPVGADRGEADGFRASVRGALGHQRLGGVAAQIFEHAQHVVGIRVDAEPRRDVDGVVDRGAVFGFRRSRRPAPPARSSRSAGATGAARGPRRRSASPDRTGSRDRGSRRAAARAAGRADRGSSLRRSEMSCAALQHVAQVMVDARNRHAELGQPLALAPARARATAAWRRAPSRRGRSRCRARTA